MLRITRTIPIVLSCVFLSSKGYSQQPGGVDGTRLWYVTEKNGNTYILKDISGNQWKSYGSNTTSEINNINFHAAFKVEPNKINPFKNFAFNQSTVAGIFYPNQPSAISDTFFKITYANRVTTLNNHSVDIGSRPPLKFRFGNRANRTTLEVLPPTNIENAMKPTIYHNGSDKVDINIWGKDKETSFLTNFSGFLPELIIYDKLLSPLQISKVESYLAMKYGITLDSSYIGRNGILWNINNNRLKKFHNRVCVIGKDSLAAFWQPKSNTTYEEIPYDAFKHDAVGPTPNTGWRFIPAFDNPSLYRSLTIAYSDLSMAAIKEGEFLFWGDDNQSIKVEDHYTVASLRNAKLISRNWLMFNENKIDSYTKVVLASRSYNVPSLSSNLYKPYDYQHFRFIIIKIDSSRPDNLGAILLNSYFGREQENANDFEFNTRTIVWDSVDWKHTSSYNYFTIGKVPLLNFLLIGKNSTTKISLGFPYDPGSPILAPSIFDTVKFEFKQTEVKTLFFDVNEGVIPLKPSIYKQAPTGEWMPLNANLISQTPPGSADIPAIPQELSSGVEANKPEPGIPAGNKIKYIKRLRKFPDQRPKPVRYYVRFPELDAVYLIKVTDKINQVTTIPVRIIRK